MADNNVKLPYEKPFFKLLSQTTYMTRIDFLCNDVIEWTLLKGDMAMVFVFDIDDTISETDAYSEYYIAKYFKENNLPYVKVKNDTRYAEAKFSWDGVTALKWYKVFGDDMMREFPCRPYAKEVINILYDMGHRVVIATARSKTWHDQPEQVTLEWLKKENIKYNKLYVGRSDKENICVDENADFFLDDDVKQCTNVANLKSKTKSLIFNTDYNKNVEVSPQITRVNSFLDIPKLAKIPFTPSEFRSIKK